MVRVYRLLSNPFRVLLSCLQECVDSGAAVTPSLLTVEQIFGELFRRREMLVEVKPLKLKGESCV